MKDFDSTSIATSAHLAWLQRCGVAPYCFDRFRVGAVQIKDFLALENVVNDSLRIAYDYQKALSNLVKNYAVGYRRIIILDCCYAETILGDMLADHDSALTVRINSAFGVPGQAQNAPHLPRQGTTVWCAANRDQEAIARDSEPYTRFMGAFMEVFRMGFPNRSPLLTTHELNEAVRARLNADFEGKHPLPVVHDPDQRDGRLSLLLDQLLGRATTKKALQHSSVSP